jgi:phosphatidylserine decarboxylase
MIEKDIDDAPKRGSANLVLHNEWRTVAKSLKITEYIHRLGLAAEKIQKQTEIVWVNDVVMRNYAKKFRLHVANEPIAIPHPTKTI